METTIIIVNYNSRPFLESCLKNLKITTAMPYEIIIIDNHSQDDSNGLLEKIKDRNIRIIQNSQNVGFAKACNQGMELAKGEYLVTMNPDITLPQGWLSRLLWHLKHYPDTLAIGPKGMGIGGPQGILPISFSSKLAAADRKFQLTYPHYSEKVKYLIGCLVVFKKQLINEIGYFDEQFPLGADDFDLSLRIRKNGFSLRVAWDVLIQHTVHGSFGRSNPEECHKLNYASWEYFEQKWQTEIQQFGWERLFEDKIPVYPQECF